MITSTQLSRCCWVRKTNLRATEQSEKFHVRQGIYRSSVSQIIHKDPHLKCYNKRRAQQLTEAHSMHALFLVCSLRDDNMITGKPAWKPKHANSVLESSEYFCQISSKLIHVMSSYTVSKLGRFFETQCSTYSALAVSRLTYLFHTSPVWRETGVTMMWQEYDVGHKKMVSGVIRTPGALFTCSFDGSVKVLEPTRQPSLITDLHPSDKEIGKVWLPGIDDHVFQIAIVGGTCRLRALIRL